MWGWQMRDQHLGAVRGGPAELGRRRFVADAAPDENGVDAEAAQDAGRWAMWPKASGA